MITNSCNPTAGNELNVKAERGEYKTFTSILKTTVLVQCSSQGQLCSFISIFIMISL